MRQLPHSGRHIALSPDGKRLVVFSPAGTASAWDLATGKEVLAFGQRLPENVIAGLLGALPRAAFTPDGQRIVSVIWDGVRVWDAQTGQEALFLRLSQAFDIAISPDGRRLAVSTESSIRILDARSGKW